MDIAIFDFEMTELKSDKGFMLCAGIKPLRGKPKVIGLHDTGVGRDPLLIDRKLVRAVRKELEQYDLWVGWNSKMFDIPFLNDRLLLIDERPIDKKMHADLMYYYRMGQSRFSSSRLDWVAKKLGCPFMKTSLDLNTWQRAELEAVDGLRGRHKNYDYIVSHCRHDLLVTEWVYNKTKGRIRNLHR